MLQMKDNYNQATLNQIYQLNLCSIINLIYSDNRNFLDGFGYHFVSILFFAFVASICLPFLSLPVYEIYCSRHSLHDNWNGERFKGFVIFWLLEWSFNRFNYLYVYYLYILRSDFLNDFFFDICNFTNLLYGIIVGFGLKRARYKKIASTCQAKE